MNSGVTVTAIGSVIINAGGNITINGTLSGDGKGYGQRSGTGAGGDNCGGAYGGSGGCNTGSNTKPYGSVTAPTHLGSGGWTGPGGGAIKLNATGTLAVNGLVSANGTNSGISSGGSGGSVWLLADTLSGGGTVRANGGDGGMGNGTGGGGRVAVHYTTDSSTLISGNKLQAFAGTGSASYRTGGAGTIYTKAASQANGNLLVDNSSAGAGDTTYQMSPVTPVSATYDNITVRNGAMYDVASGYTLALSAGGTLFGGGSSSKLIIHTGGHFDSGDSDLSVSGLDFTNYGTFHSVTDLTVGSGTYVHLGTFEQPMNSLTVNSGGYFEQRKIGTQTFSGAVTVNSGGYLLHTANSGSKSYELNISAETIDVKSGGYVYASGRGYAAATGTGAGTGNAGGSYGGRGGTPTAATYGSVSAPTDLGSGGGHGAGGGTIKLVGTTSINVGGTVTADGVGNVAGGGSGGSIWIQAPSLTGSGTIRANGGYSPADSGGGGGRIAVISTGGNVPAYTFQAYGGTGDVLSEEAAAGTIYTKSASQTYGDLLVDNNGLVANSTTNQVASTSLTFRNVVVRNGAKYIVPSGSTLNVNGGTLSGSGTSPSLTINSGGALGLADATVASGVSLSNSGGTVLSGDMTVTGVTYAQSTTITGGLDSLTVGSGGNFRYITTSPLFSGSELIIQDGGTFTQENTTTIEVTTLRVETGGTLTHCDNSTSKACEVDISATTVEIQSGAIVNANGLGFNASTGTGAGGDAAAGGGAGYGAAGGSGYVGGVAQSNGGPAYGSETAPTDLGSGGGNDTGGGSGGSGGGAVKIIASGTMTVNGTIRANGSGGSANQAGGGSGGSIWLEADALAGSSGAVTVTGGAGSGNDTDGGGCGAGGRIRVFYGSSTYGGTFAAASGCTGPRGGTAGTVSEELSVPSFTGFTLTPASPFIDDSILIETVATFESGVDRIELYLDGTAAGDRIHTCNPAGTSDPLACDYLLAPLPRGSHTVTAKAFGPSGQEGTAADTFFVAGYTDSNRPMLSRLKAGVADVDFTLSFTLDGSSTGTLEVTFPAAFDVTRAPGAVGSSACLSNFGMTAQTMTATKTDCNGAITLAGGQVTNPFSVGAYTISWTNDNGSAQVYIVDDDQVSVTGSVDPTLSFDLDVSTGSAETAAPYAVDFGPVAAGSPEVSDNSAIPSIWIDLATNAGGGAAVTVQSANAALQSTSAPTDEIASTTQALSTGTEAYGVCVDPALAGTLQPGDSFAAAAPYAATCDGTSSSVVGLLQTGAQNLLAATGPVAAGRAQIRVGVAVTTGTPAHPDYTDTLTFLATATF